MTANQNKLLAVFASLAVATTYACGAALADETGASGTAGDSPATSTHLAPKVDGVASLWDRYNRMGKLALEKHDLASAISFFQQAIDEATVLGEKDPHLPFSMDQLAQIYFAQDDFEHALPLYQHALEIREKALAADDPTIASSLAKVARVYRAQQNYEKAEPLLKQALQIMDKHLSSGSDIKSGDAAEKVSIITDLSDSYQSEGRMAQAEDLYKTLLSGDVAKTPEVAQALESYALLLCKANRSAEAEGVLQQALSIKEKTFGANDASVAGTLNNLAEVYRTENKFAEAEPLYQRALKIWQSVSPLGRDRAAVSANLALLYKAQGKFAEAKPLMVQALSIDQRAAGPFNLDVAVDLTNLASIHQALKEPGEAEVLYEQALPVLEKNLGAQNQLVIETKKNLSLLKNARKTADVEHQSMQ